MSLEVTAHPTREVTETEIETTLTLADLLHNTIVLHHIAPILPIASLLKLAATSRAIRDLLYHTPGVFRHLDLSRSKAAELDVFQISTRDSQETEDAYYSGHLRGIFTTLQKRHVLQDVQTLLLDGLSVTSELVHDIINDPSFNVRILSLRDVKNLNHGKLRQALQYACRPGRPEGMPKLKALYIFGSRYPKAYPVTRSRVVGIGGPIISYWNGAEHIRPEPDGESDAWWSRKGRVVTTQEADAWVSCMQACEGIIAFDAVLCKGPRHHGSPAYGQHPVLHEDSGAVATIAAPPCDSCGKAPEGLVLPSAPLASLPALEPPPITSSSLRAAVTPHGPVSPFVPRCRECLMERYCTTCHKWWCEACYVLPGQASLDVVDIVEEADESWNMGGWEGSESGSATSTGKSKARVSKSCWECGNNCDDCINHTQKVCKKCRAGYCTVHNEGSCSTYCDWCHSRGRGLGRL